MKRRNSYIATALCVLLAGAAIAGCSIKEDRSDCPCYLDVDISKADTAYRYKTATISITEARLISQEEVQYNDYRTKYYSQKVPRTIIRTSVLAGCNRASVHGDTLLVKEGSQFDPVFAHTNTLNCTGQEDMLDVAVFHKRHCKATFLIEGAEEGEPYPYDLRIRANYNGFDLFTLAPNCAPFRYSLVPDNTGAYYAYLPPQGDDSMIIDALDPATGTIEWQLKLGAQLKEQGYDWTRKDLEDITVVINLVKATFTITVLDWETGKPIDMEI